MDGSLHLISYLARIAACARLYVCELKSEQWSYDLDGDLMRPVAGRQQLLGDGFSLHEAGRGQDGSPAVLVYHHGRPGVDVGPVENGLAELLHVKGGDGLGVCQLGGKHLHHKETESSRSFIFPLPQENLFSLFKMVRNSQYHRDADLVGLDVHVRTDD